MARESTLKPFARGDIFAGATLLNRPEDDHAGDGRIIQYDADLNEKGVLWTDTTTHLVGGLRFAPDGILWAFDSNAHEVVRVGTDGKALPRKHFADRAFSTMNFLPDGNLLFGEHLVGNTIKLPPERPLGTTLSKMPGTDLFGYGHIYKFTPDGKLLEEYSTATNGGMGGFLGVTTISTAPDGRTVVYVSETGPTIYRYDIEADKQLPDLATMPPGELVILAVHRPDGTLLAIKGSRTAFTLQHMQVDGEVTKEWALPGPGWATIAETLEPEVVLLGNFFTGTIMKFDLKTGAPGAKAETGVQRSLAGIAQFRG